MRCSPFGTPEWRSLARLMCRAEYEALERVVERDEGNYNGETSIAFLAAPVAPLATEIRQPPLSLDRLFDDYISSRKSVGKGFGADARWKPVIKELRKFIGHSDVRKLTKRDLLRWRDAKLQSLAPKTVSDVYLACIRTILQWALENDLLPANEAAHVRQEVGKTIRNREKGYGPVTGGEWLNASGSVDRAGFAGGPAPAWDRS